MAKYKRKRRRYKQAVQKLAAPPLSKLDKGIYIALILLGVLLAVAPLFVSMLFQDHVAHADPTVVCSVPRGWVGLWIILSLVFVSCPLAGLFLDAFMTRQPIFGRDDVTYGAAGGRVEIYPLFGKHRRSLIADKTPPPKSGRVLVVVVVVIVIALSVLFSVLSLFGRIDLHKDLSVTVKNGFNIETRCYGADEIEAVTFALDIHYHRGSERYRAMVIFNMEDGREYEMAAEPSTLLWVKNEIHDGIPVDYRMDISVDEYAKKVWLNERETAILQEVFPDS